MSTTTTIQFRDGTGEPFHVKSRAANVWVAVENGSTIKEAGEAMGYSGGAASAALARVREAIASGRPVVIDDDAAHPFVGADGVSGEATTKATLDRMEYAASINRALPHILSMLDGNRADADALNAKATKLETEAAAMRARANDAYAAVVGDLGGVLADLGVPDLAAFEADYAAKVAELEAASTDASDEKSEVTTTDEG